MFRAWEIATEKLLACANGPSSVPTRYLYHPLSERVKPARMELPPAPAVPRARRGSRHQPSPRRASRPLPTPVRGLWREALRSEEHTSELQSPCNLVCRLLLEKKKKTEQQGNHTMQGDAAYAR